jgi:hypothetical protein
MHKAGGGEVSSANKGHCNIVNDYDQSCWKEMRDSVTSLAPVSLFVISCWLLLAHLVTPEGGLDFGCRLVQVGVRQVDVQFFFGILETKIV